MLYSDGRKIKQETPQGDKVELRARWKGRDFVIERKLSGGASITETYLRASESEQFYVIIQVEAQGFPRPIAFRRVYDPAQPNPRSGGRNMYAQLPEAPVLTIFAETMETVYLPAGRHRCGESPRWRHRHHEHHAGLRE